MKRTVLALTLATALLAASPASSAAFPASEDLLAIDDALLHGTITPPGTPLLEKEKELRAYDDLVQGYPTLTEDEITTKYFKDGSFDVPTDVSREYFPRADVKVLRDTEWGVPHVYGEDDLAAAFGAGYVAIEDRLPIIMLLIALGRAEAFELLGDNASWLADAEIARIYGYTEAEFQSMIDRIPATYGQDGQDLVDLLDEIVQGMNAAVLDMRSGLVPVPPALADAGLELPAPFQTTDIVAIVSIVRALFGAGGGAELANANRFLSAVADLGPEKGAAAYEDLRNRFNEDGIAHTLGSFPYQQPPEQIDPAAMAFGYGSGATGVEGLLEEITSIFPGGLEQAVAQSGELAEASRIKTENLVVRSPLGAIDLSRPAGSMSNFLAVDGTLSSTGHPMLIGGPQAGYFDPQILSENEIHGDRLHARGATFPAFGLVIVGRTGEQAWSPTAGGSDMIDMYVEELCEPDGSAPTEQSRHYLFQGECLEMDRRVLRTVTDAAPADLPGRDLLPDIIVERTVHGPVVGRGKVGDKPVAVSRKRSTYLKELDPGVSILKLNRGELDTPQRFVDAFEESHNLSTNWAWIDRDDVEDPALLGGPVDPHHHHRGVAGGSRVQAGDDVEPLHAVGADPDDAGGVNEWLTHSDLAYVHGGLYPIRPDDVHPDFPVWGTGQWEWAKGADGRDRFLAEHPHDLGPKRHYAVSWNNRPAPDWSGSDAQWGWSSLYRADLLEDQLLGAKPRSITPVKLVQMMEHAGLSDLRGTHVLPKAFEVLQAAQPPTPEAAAARDALAAWVADGALRRDGDGDGAYDDAAAVGLMDAWWEPMIRAIYDPVLGDVGARSAVIFHNAPGSGGSAFMDGFYGQVWTDLSQVLGDDLRAPTSQVYCGSDAAGTDGTLAACAERLWASLAAVADAAPNDGSGERIQFLPTAALSMHWVNRPTTQHVAMFGRLGGPAAAPPAPVRPGAGGALPATGPAAGIGLGALVLLTLLGAVALRRRRADAPPS